MGKTHQQAEMEKNQGDYNSHELKENIVNDVSLNKHYITQHRLTTSRKIILQSTKN